MEALLNTLWLVIGLLSVCMWASLRRATAGASGWWLRSVVALCCYVVLVFPLISISDDLQYSQVAIEESDGTASRGKIVKCTECKTNIHHHHASAVTPSSYWHSPEWRVAGSTGFDPVQPARDIPGFASSERAPPPACLS